MQIALGQTYRRAIVDEALERLRETLRDEGLYRAEVSAETAPHPEIHQMDSIVHVQSGTHARVGNNKMKNETEHGDADKHSRSKKKAGSASTSHRLQRGPERIQKDL